MMSWSGLDNFFENRHQFYGTLPSTLAVDPTITVETVMAPLNHSLNVIGISRR